MTKAGTTKKKLSMKENNNQIIRFYLAMRRLLRNKANRLKKDNIENL